jgi:hypothetical protein
MPTLVDCQIWLFGVNGAIQKKQRNHLVFTILSRLNLDAIGNESQNKDRIERPVQDGGENAAALVVLLSISHAVGAECYSAAVPVVWTASGEE